MYILQAVQRDVPRSYFLPVEERLQEFSQTRRGRGQLRHENKVSFTMVIGLNGWEAIGRDGRHKDSDGHCQK